ncbi:TadE/TadG family type IV pilus assembly protein [Serratia marcescens]|uniref:TadE/TadG family type IV pilus assembly protein n=1 Tax=Serratia marcescens TaxID=615 RepID=UPI0002B86E85|nr:TadE/TadG family type IV pilus assembly protein [Serratia marcescens]EMF04253.1 protein TadG, associated with Flp pilus assembly [Serratia marcescens VGH107]
MPMYQKGLRLCRRFYDDQRGAFVISFVMMSGFLLAMAAFGLEGSRYINERARLSDAMEQAALALTAEDNGADAPRNYTLSQDWFRAYIRHGETVYQPVVKILHGTSTNGSKLAYVEYRVSGQTLRNSWFSSTLFPSFDKQVVIGDNGAARKYRSNIDVMFVADFSGSMNDESGGSTKLIELKRIVLQLAHELYNYDIDNKIGFTPFAWGTKSGGACTPQFVANRPVPVNILSDLQQIGALEGYVNFPATVAAIPNPVHDMQFPMENVAQSACLKNTNTYVVPLTSNYSQISQIQSMNAHGGTLVGSGVLLGAQELAKGTASRKVLVIVSDGTDDPVTNNITPRLLNAGMCDRIRSVLSTKESVGKISFIGIGYKPTVDWETCVGKRNFYLPQNISQLEDDMRRTVFEEVGHNTIKD